MKVPVIASLNGTTNEGWLSYAKTIQEAGADALELNVYFIATDPKETGAQVEQRTVEILRSVKKAVTIPVAVKLSPFFSSVAHLAHQLDDAGADGLVLFNRFYQPDIDVEALEAVPSLHLSDSSELLLRLHWLAILSGQVKATLAASGGVHTGLDAVKAVMAGASRRAGGVAPARGRPAAAAHHLPGHEALDGGARLRVARADARQHEPAQEPGSGGVRARQLHEGAAELEGSGVADGR